MNNLLIIKNLEKSYYTIDGEVKAIKDLSMEVKDGEFIAIVGPSGCGKSTLFSILCGIENETGGIIE